SENNDVKALGVLKVIEDNGEKEERIEWNDPLTGYLDIDFPPILEKDVQAAVQAVITALTLNGQELRLLDEVTATRLILKAMGEDDVDEIMAELFPDGGLDTSETSTRSTRPADTASEARVKAAARKLAEAILEAKKSGALENLTRG
ncbi:MAG: hypothetical protein JNJ72_20150, partial [Anaerolineales bacterium]|nr:hypothetical protein [Anaerolineales bacterium]